MTSAFVAFLVVFAISATIKGLISLGRWIERREQRGKISGDLETAERIVHMINGSSSAPAAYSGPGAPSQGRNGLVRLLGGRFDGDEIPTPPERQEGILRVSLQREEIVPVWVDSPAAPVSRLPFPAADYYVEDGIGRLVNG